jgi:hypothetical protein
VALFASLLLAGLVFGTRVTISGDPRDMGAVDDELEHRRRQLSSLFPGLMDQALLVTTGKTMEKALQANDELYGKLLDRGVDPTQIISISPLLPSQSTQTQALAVASKLLGADGSNLWPVFEKAGFSPGYYKGLGKMLETPPVESKSFDDTSLAPVLSEAIKQWNDDWYVITRVRARDDEAVDKIASVANAVSRCTLASERLAARSALGALQRELVWMLIIWIAVSVPLLCLIERSVGFGLKAVLPAVIGVITAIGLFGLAGRPLTPVASAGVTLVMGLGIDYGIFMLSGTQSPDKSPPAMGVLASALTTIAAFGVLAFARVQAIADLGLIVLVGVSTALVCALLLLPVLSRRRESTEVSR